MRHEWGNFHTDTVALTQISPTSHQQTRTSSLELALSLSLNTQAFQYIHTLPFGVALGLLGRMLSCRVLLLDSTSSSLLSWSGERERGLAALALSPSQDNFGNTVRRLQQGDILARGRAWLLKPCCFTRVTGVTRQKRASLSCWMLNRHAALDATHCVDAATVVLLVEGG